MTRPKPSRREEHKEETRKALIAAGRHLFARHGYAGVSIEDVVVRARVTRGALYHHFADKQDLFRAILEAVETDLVDEVRRALEEVSDPWQSLVSGLQAFLTAATKPAALRIVTIDGPAVLGWGEWREIDTRFGLRLVSAGLQRAIDAGVLVPAPVQALAHMLLAALTESALLIADASDRELVRADVERAFLALLEGMRLP